MISRVKFSEELLRKIFDSLSAHIAIIDEKGFILETNAAWKRFSETGGMSSSVDFTKINYLSVCDAAGGNEKTDGNSVATGIRKVINGEIDEFLYDYPCHSPSEKRWFYMRAVPMEEEGPVRVIISHEDITKLKIMEEELRKNQIKLEDKNQGLEEANIALKVVIEQREKDRDELEKRLLNNVKTLVFPYISKLKSARLSEKDKTLVSIIDDHLNDIVSPMMQKLNNADIFLTPQELQVASLVKDGKTTTEIADILFISEATVNFHRKNLRTKLGLKNKKTNLRSFLLSMI